MINNATERVSTMRNIGRNLLGRLVAGVIVVAPVYLTILLLLKAMSSVAGLVRPIALLLPDWLPGEDLVALLCVLILCLIVGMLVRTAGGRAISKGIERSLLRPLPGYSLLRSLTQRLAGKSEGQVWKPALAEIEEALVPAFIIEEFDDGRYTVFVPSVPTPFAGAVYILERGRVHPLDASFAKALMVVSRWGEGARELVAAMDRSKR